MLNRMQNRERRARRAIVQEAVREAQTTFTPPASPERGAIAALGGATVPDADGNTISAFLLNADALDDTTPRL